MKNRKSGDAGMKYDPAQVRVHEAYTVAIRDLGVHGEGIGSVGGFTVFVPGVLPGETVTAEITLLKKSYALGKLLSIEQKSPFRVVPECPVYENCGGCQLSHLTYEGQLDMKYRRVKDVIERIAGESGKLVRPVLPAAHPFAYRNKMAVPAGLVKGKAALGCYRQGSHDIIPVSSCAIQKEENNRLLRFARRFIKKYGISVYDEKTRKGSLRHVMGRVGDDGKVMVVLVTASETLPEEKRWIEEIQKELPEAVSLWHNIQPKPGNTILGAKIRHLWGRETLTASLCGLRFEVSPYSFFQVHKEQAEILYEKALEYADLKGGETVIDAYCGTGTISLCLAKKAKRVIGIEIVKPAIEDAKKNAKKNHMENTEFYAADAGKLMPQLYRKGLVPDVIVMDPVRAGCSEEVLKAAAGMNPKRIVYVSCNPATFARDTKILKLEGYEIKEVQPVDMFPQTMHVEAIVLLSKLDSKNHISVELPIDDMDLTSAESKATYKEIQNYVLEKFGFKVSNLYIAQVKEKCGIKERENYNKSKKEDLKQPICPIEKEEAIKDAFRYFQMI
ncbi:MAG: 23S rRNA (uracil(1939)-C(5))-methyltransferase RlmD [Dialister invisus]|uniref:23S rRNA (Uracil(1939)-C(5))-methyltransferase RlmD n=1 Tax=Dialister invisus TaxID=218538 RepID=A0A930FPL3_9FIRM|nr:23S rRNA (uracil(1939)-C(5))-methyltransferase RlmD [Dialister invisus]